MIKITAILGIVLILLVSCQPVEQVESNVEPSPKGDDFDFIPYEGLVSDFEQCVDREEQARQRVLEAYSEWDRYAMSDSSFLIFIEKREDIVEDCLRTLHSMKDFIETNYNIMEEEGLNPQFEREDVLATIEDYEEILSEISDAKVEIEYS